MFDLFLVQVPDPRLKISIPHACFLNKVSL